MNRKKRMAVIIVTVICFVGMLAVVVGIGSYFFAYTPKGSNLPNKPVIHYDENNEPVVLRPREDENYNFFVLGLDRKASLTDVFMLVNYNVTEGSVSILQIPRDTFVSYGVPTSKINATYNTFYAETVASGSNSPEIDTVRRIADMVEKAFCTKISYCAIMNLEGFKEIVDSIGGVEINVPYEVIFIENHTGKKIKIPTGQQTLDGEMAELFVRFRSGFLQADHGRQDAQKIFMSAFIKNLQESVSVSMISGLSNTMLENIYTDLTVSDTVYFGRKLLGVDMSKITMVSMPSCPSDTGHVIMVKKLMAKLINEKFNVYDGEITESIFDKDKLFVTQSNQSIINAYYAENNLYGGNEYNADSVDDGSINIPYNTPYK